MIMHVRGWLTAAYCTLFMGALPLWWQGQRGATELAHFEEKINKATKSQGIWILVVSQFWLITYKRSTVKLCDTKHCLV